MPARRVTANSANRLTVTLDAADRAALEKMATDTGRSTAWLVREAIREYLAPRDSRQRETK